MATSASTILLTLEAVDEISSVVQEINDNFELLGSTLQEIVTRTEEASSAIDEIATSLTSAQGAITSADSTFADLAATIDEVTANAQELTDSLPEELDTLSGAVETSVGIMTGSLTTLDGALDAALASFTELEDTATTAMSEMSDALTTIVVELTGKIESEFGDMVDTITAELGELEKRINALFDGLSDSMGAEAEEAAGKVEDEFGDMADETEAAVNEMVDTVTDRLAAMTDELNGVPEGTGDVVKAFSGMTDAVNTEMDEMVGDVTAATTKIDEQMNLMGAAMGEMIAEGMRLSGMTSLGTEFGAAGETRNLAGQFTSPGAYSFMTADQIKAQDELFAEEDKIAQERAVATGRTVTGQFAPGGAAGYSFMTADQIKAQDELFAQEDVIAQEQSMARAKLTMQKMMATEKPALMAGPTPMEYGAYNLGASDMGAGLGTKTSAVGMQGFLNEQMTQAQTEYQAILAENIRKITAEVEEQMVSASRASAAGTKATLKNSMLLNQAGLSRTSETEFSIPEGGAIPYMGLSGATGISKAEQLAAYEKYYKQLAKVQSITRFKGIGNLGVGEMGYNVRNVLSGSTSLLGGAKAEKKGGVGSLLSGAKPVVELFAGYEVGKAMFEGAKTVQQSAQSIGAALSLAWKPAMNLTKQLMALSYTAEFSASSGETFDSAFAGVAGVLDSVWGKATTAANAVKLMTQADIGAGASHQNLAAYTKGLAAEIAAFHVKAGNTKEAMTVLTNMLIRTGLNVNPLTTMFQRFGSRLAGAGLTAKQFGGILLELQRAGVTGQRGIYQATTSIQALADPTANVLALLTRLGVQVYNSQGKYVGLSNVLGGLYKAYEKLPSNINAAHNAFMLQKDQVRLSSLEAQGNTVTSAAQAKMINAVTQEVKEELNVRGNAVQKAEAYAYAQQQLNDANELAVLMSRRKTTQIGVEEAAIEKDMASRKKQNLELTKQQVNQQIFGRNQDLMNSFAKLGAKGWNDQAKEVDNYNHVQNAANLNQKTFSYWISRTKAVLDTFLGTIGLELLPTLTKWIETLVKLMVTVSEFIIQHKALLIAIGAIIASLALLKIITMATSWMNGLSASAKLFSLAGQGVGLTIRGLGGLLSNAGGEIGAFGEHMNSVGRGMQNWFDNIGKGGMENWQAKKNAIATQEEQMSADAEATATKMDEDLSGVGSGIAPKIGENLAPVEAELNGVAETAGTTGGEAGTNLTKDMDTNIAKGMPTVDETVATGMAGVDETVATGMGKVDTETTTGMAGMGEATAAGMAKVDEETATGMAGMDEAVAAGAAKADEELATAGAEGTGFFGMMTKGAGGAMAALEAIVALGFIAHDAVKAVANAYNTNLLAKIFGSPAQSIDGKTPQESMIIFLHSFIAQLKKHQLTQQEIQQDLKAIETGPNKKLLMPILDKFLDSTASEKAKVDSVTKAVKKAKEAETQLKKEASTPIGPITGGTLPAGVNNPYVGPFSFPTKQLATWTQNVEKANGPTAAFSKSTHTLEQALIPMGPALAPLASVASKIYTLVTNAGPDIDTMAKDFSKMGTNLKGAGREFSAAATAIDHNSRAIKTFKDLAAILTSVSTHLPTPIKDVTRAFDDQSSAENRMANAAMTVGNHLVKLANHFQHAINIAKNFKTTLDSHAISIVTTYTNALDTIRGSGNKAYEVMVTLAGKMSAIETGASNVADAIGKVLGKVSQLPIYTQYVKDYAKELKGLEGGGTIKTEITSTSDAEILLPALALINSHLPVISNKVETGLTDIHNRLIEISGPISTIDAHLTGPIQSDLSDIDTATTGLQRRLAGSIQSELNTIGGSTTATQSTLSGIIQTDLSNINTNVKNLPGNLAPSFQDIITALHPLTTMNQTLTNIYSRLAITNTEIKAVGSDITGTKKYDLDTLLGKIEHGIQPVGPTNVTINFHNPKLTTKADATRLAKVIGKEVVSSALPKSGHRSGR